MKLDYDVPPGRTKKCGEGKRGVGGAMKNENGVLSVFKDLGQGGDVYRRGSLKGRNETGDFGKNPHSRKLLGGVPLQRSRGGTKIRGSRERRGGRVAKC